LRKRLRPNRVDDPVFYDAPVRVMARAQVVPSRSRATSKSNSLR
jgi:hypothetical protein